MRGIVIGPPARVIRKPDRVELHTLPMSGIDPLLRRYALYWDRIDLARDRFVGGPLTADADLLRKEHVLTETVGGDRVLDAKTAPTLFARAQLDVFGTNEAEAPGSWSVALSADIMTAIPDVAPPIRGVVVELVNALPVPDPATPIVEVLEFKRRREAELLALQARLDEFYAEIARSGDVAHATSVALAKIDRALLDLDRVAAQSFAKRMMESLSIELNVNDIAAGAMSGAAAAAALGVAHPLVGMVVGAAGAAIKFGFGLRPRPRSSPEASAFAYAFAARDVFTAKE